MSPSMDPHSLLLGGCRVDSLEILHLVLGLNISLFALDFSGSGQSEGQGIL